MPKDMSLTSSSRIWTQRSLALSVAPDNCLDKTVVSSQEGLPDDPIKPWCGFDRTPAREDSESESWGPAGPGAGMPPPSPHLLPLIL